MFALLETAIAFSAAMLAVSLFISAAVQWISNIGRYRSIILIDMLRTLIHGFRVYHNDPQAVAADQPGASPAQHRSCSDTETAFVNDVLSDPVLHSRDVKLAYQDNPAALARQIEYIHEQDLVALVYNLATNPAPGSSEERGPAGRRGVDGSALAQPVPVDAVSAPAGIKSVVRTAGVPDLDLNLPDAWVGRSAADPKTYATAANFAAYVGRWFSTIEGTAAQRYKQLVRRLTFVVAAIAVVLFNIDSIHILSTLHNSTAQRTALLQRLDDLNLLASRGGARDASQAADSAPSVPDRSQRERLLDMQKSLSILSSAGLSLGWKDSWIVKRFCAYRGLCGDSSPPTRGQLAMEVLFWLAGLLFSCVLLSLGAPFWVGTLSRLINLKNEVQQRKEQEPYRDEDTEFPVGQRTRTPSLPAS